MGRIRSHPLASDPAAGPPVDAFLLQPPYEKYTPRVQEARFKQPLPAGTVCIVSTDDLGRSLPVIRRAVIRIRSTQPSVPIVLGLPPDYKIAAYAGEEIAELFRVDAVMSIDDAVEPTLRTLLTSPADLTADVIEWLSDRGLPPAPEVTTVLRAIFEREAPDRSLFRTLRPLGVSPRAARAWFARSAIGPPREWQALARALRAALAIQRTPQTALLTIALENGYSDYSSLSRQFARLFSTSATQVRACLGWKWLMDRWLEKRQAAGIAHGRPVGDMTETA